MELDGPLIKTPYELLNNIFRNSQKVVEKELSQVVAAIATLEKNKANLTPTEVYNTLSELSVQLETLRTKRAAVAKDETKWILHCSQRLHDLPTDPMEERATTLPPSLRKRYRSRLNASLGVHLRSRGREKSAALLFQGEPSASPEGAVSEMVAMVTKALEEHDVAPALTWCARHRAALRKRESSLEFQLRRQQFLTLVRKGDRAAALSYGRAHLGPFAERFPVGVAQAMTALALGPSSNHSVYRSLFAAERWEELKNLFVEEVALLYHVIPSSPLYTYLEAGLGALKTPQCEHPDDGPGIPGLVRTQCPVCLPLFRRAAAGVASGSHTVSALVCQLSGEAMDDSNPPLVFPSGSAYGQRALQRLAQRQNGWVTCPRTHETCRFEDLRKAYIS